VFSDGFSVVCDSAPITSIVSKWWPINFIFKDEGKVGWVGTTVMLFWGKNSLVKKKRQALRCREATGSSFVAKVRREVFSYFHAVAVKRHSSVQT
jgi:hypothetical protein